MEIKFLTPTAVWEGYDPKKDDLEASIVGTEIDGNIVCSKQFFTSETVDGKKIRVLSELFYDKRWSDPRGAVLAVPSISLVFYKTLINLLINDGYVVLVVDYYGEPSIEPRTAYPSNLLKCQYPNCKSHLNTIDESVKDTIWFTWAKIIRRSITFLEEQSIVDSNKICLLGMGTGAQIGWNVAAMDKRIKAFVPVSGGGFQWAIGKPKFTFGNIPQTDEERAFSMGIGSETYAKSITCPTLFMSSIIAKHNDVDRAGDLLGLVNTKNKSLLFSTTLEPQISTSAYKTFQMWLRKIMSSIEEEILIPSITFENIENNLYIKLNIEQKIENKEIFVCYGEPNSNLRSWQSINNIIQINETTYSCNIPVFDNKELIVAYANVRNNNGYVVSTQIIGIKPVDLGIKTSDIIEKTNPRILYDESMGIGPFKVKTKDFILEDDTLFNKNGPLNISGITAKTGDIVLYRNIHELKMLERTSLLHFDVYSPTARELRINMLSLDATQKYSTVLDLTGGDFWQKITLDCSDFKTLNGKSLTSFTDTKVLTIVDAKDIILTNFLWI